MNTRFSKLTFCHILETFASTFNSQETIVFLQSFAQKLLGSFLRTAAIPNEHGFLMLHAQQTPPPTKTLGCSWLNQLHSNSL